MSSNNRANPAWPLRVALGVAVAFVLVLLVGAAAKGWRDLDSVRHRKAVLDERIARSETEIARLERRLDLLENDPDTLERMAREELGMVRPGDRVIVLRESSADGGAPTPLELN